MAITLVGAVARHERRIRLLFDQPLAPAALTNAGLYAVIPATGAAARVGVSGLVLVLGEAHAVELALAADLADGAAYRVRAEGIPARDGTITPPGTEALVRIGGVPAKASGEMAVDDIAELLYGVDCVWSGTDYLETAAGDLASVTGPANVEAALERRLQSAGLPWDDSYGAKPRAYVDGSPGALSTLKGALIRQAHEDDRVKEASATLVVEGEDAFFDVEARLIGEGDVTNLTVRSDAFA